MSLKALLKSYNKKRRNERERTCVTTVQSINRSGIFISNSNQRYT